jgi:hypothetical protein
MRAILFSTFSIFFSFNLYAAESQNPCLSPDQTFLSPPSNQLKNAAFDGQNTPTDWALVSGGSEQLSRKSESNGYNTLVLAPSEHQKVTLMQPLNLKAKTLYTASVCVKGKSDVPPTLMIEGGVQREKTQSYLERGVNDDVWTLYRFIFYTTSGHVRLTLSGYKNSLGARQEFRFPMVVEGRLPAPIPELPSHGENMVLNPDFQDGGQHWVFDLNDKITSRECDSSSLCYASLTASPEFSARVSQVLPFEISAHSNYVLSAKVKTLGNEVKGHVFVTVKGVDLSPKKGWFSTDGEWQNLEYTFTTGDDVSNVKVMLESYKQAAEGKVSVTDVRFYALGQEDYASNSNATPKEPGILVQDFATYQKGEKLNTSDWLLPNKAWGGDNLGVIGSNVVFASDQNDGQFLQMNVWGSKAPADKVREGAALVTKEYFASGVYLVCARAPKHQGVVTAFWPFHYLSYKATDKEYWNEPNPIRNTEIDWEFPTSNKDNSVPVSYALGRLNSWGGQFGGEGGNASERVDLLKYNAGHLINEDDEFHQYGIIWFSGHDNPDGTRIPGYVKWTFNRDCESSPPQSFSQSFMHSLQVVRNTDGESELSGESYGQDNIPFRAARFWIGAWFPGIADKPYHAGGLTYWGWGGTPDFDEDQLDIKWVAIYPWKTTGLTPTANRDKWEAETVPDSGNWSPTSDYPVAGGNPLRAEPDYPPNIPEVESEGPVSVQFDSGFPLDKTVTLMWVSKGVSLQKSLGKNEGGFQINPDVGTHIQVDSYVCWDNKGDRMRDGVTGIFLSMQKTWVKCKLQ